eukprot:jgi/Psemu1/242144/estExt_Genewise1.C_2630032
MHSGHNWVCELPDDDSARLGLKYVEIVDLGRAIESNNNIYGMNQVVSGESTVTFNKAVIGNIGSDPKMYIPVDTRVEVVHMGSAQVSNNNGANQTRSYKTFGELTALVVRVVDPDGKGPEESLSTLEESFFCEDGCLQSQLEACSYGKLKIKPFSGTIPTTKDTVENGVVELRLDDFHMYENVISVHNVAKDKFGDLNYDLILYCMPFGGKARGTVNWLGVAFGNGQASFYNGKCSIVQLQLHEVGHNLGMGHSGTPQNGYGDVQGFMGYSPLSGSHKCYNPAKSYNTRWYDDKAKTIDPLTLSRNNNNKDGAGEETETTFVLNGISDYQQSADDSPALVILRLEQTEVNSDYYIGYNRKDGINRDTHADGDMVTIVRKEGDPDAYAVSTKVACLQVGYSYRIPDYNGDTSKSVTVRFVGVQNDLRDATVGISVGSTTVCKDRAGKFENIQNKRGKPKNRPRNCRWVGRKKQCKGTSGDTPLSTYCPKTCGMCGLSLVLF